MIKIEHVEGSCSITRNGEVCTLFPGMIIYPEEVETIVSGGNLIYSIDETMLVRVQEGEKATINSLHVEEEETVAEPAVQPEPVEVVPAKVEAPVKAGKA